MDISELTSIVAPPTAAAAPIDWQEIERQVGNLPRDYKQLIDTYGPGTFMGDLGVGGPNWILSNGDFPGAVDLLHRIARSGPRSVGVSPYNQSRAAVGTEHDTYLAWGGASGGQTGFWRTTNPNPDEWPILFTEFSAIDYEPRGIVAYIVDIVSGRFDSVALPEDWLSESITDGSPKFVRRNE